MAREKLPAMETRVDAVVLWARASLVGLLAFGLGVVGHVTADGLLPSTVVLAVLLVFSVLLSVPMLNRPASSMRIVAMLVAGQTFIHLVLAVTAGHRGDGSATGAASPRRVPQDCATCRSSTATGSVRCRTRIRACRGSRRRWLRRCRSGT